MITKELLIERAEAKREFLAKVFANPNYAVLAGQSGVGKSELVKNVMERSLVENPGRIIIQCRAPQPVLLWGDEEDDETESAGVIYEFWKDFVCALETELSKKRAANELDEIFVGMWNTYYENWVTDSPSKDILRNPLAFIKKMLYLCSGMHLVLVIENAEDMMKDSVTDELIRQLLELKEAGMKLSVLLVSREMLEDITAVPSKELESAFETKVLEGFEPEEWNAYAKALKSCMRISDDAIDKIKYYCGNHPGLLDALCSKLINSRQEEVTEETVHAAFENSVKQEVEGLFEEKYELLKGDCIEVENAGQWRESLEEAGWLEDLPLYFADYTWNRIINEDTLFIGRREAIEELHESIFCNKPQGIFMAVTGPNEVGKSVLVERARDIFKKRMLPNVIIAEVSLESLTAEENHAYLFWKNIFSQIFENDKVTALLDADKKLKKIQDNFALSEGYRANVQNDVITAFGILNDAHIYTIINVDEFDEAHKRNFEPQFFNTLSELYKKKFHISLVVQARRSVTEPAYEEKFAGIFQPYILSGFHDGEWQIYEECLEVDIQYRENEGEETAKDRILYYCGRHPKMLMTMRKALRKKYAGSEYLTAADVDKCYNDEEAGFRNSVKERLESTCFHLLELLKQEQMDMTGEMSCLKPFVSVWRSRTMPEEKRQNWMRKLYMRGFIMRSSEGYEPISPLAVDYIVENVKETVVEEVTVEVPVAQNTVAEKSVNEAAADVTVGREILAEEDEFDLAFAETIAEMESGQWAFDEEEEEDVFFIGRDYELGVLRDNIFKNVPKGIFMAVTGPNEVGKSTLIERARNEFIKTKESNVIIAEVSLKSVSGDKNHAFIFWQKIFSQIERNSFVRKLRETDSEDGKKLNEICENFSLESGYRVNVQNDVVEAFRILDEAKICTILNVDEFDEAPKNNFEAQFYSTIFELKEKNYHMSMVVAARGSIMAPKYDEKFGKLFVPLRLSGFNDDEWKAYEDSLGFDIERKEAGEEETAKDRIRYYCGRHTRMLVIMRESLIKQYGGQEKISAAEVDRCYKSGRTKTGEYVYILFQEICIQMLKLLREEMIDEYGKQNCIGPFLEICLNTPIHPNEIDGWKKQLYWRGFIIETKDGYEPISQKAVDYMADVVRSEDMASFAEYEEQAELVVRKVMLEGLLTRYNPNDPEVKRKLKEDILDYVMPFSDNGLKGRFYKTFLASLKKEGVDIEDSDFSVLDVLSYPEYFRIIMGYWKNNFARRLYLTELKPIRDTKGHKTYRKYSARSLKEAIERCRSVIEACAEENALSGMYANPKPWEKVAVTGDIVEFEAIKYIDDDDSTNQVYGYMNLVGSPEEAYEAFISLPKNGSKNESAKAWIGDGARHLAKVCKVPEEKLSMYILDVISESSEKPGIAEMEAFKNAAKLDRPTAQEAIMISRDDVRRIYEIQTSDGAFVVNADDVNTWDSPLYGYIPKKRRITVGGGKKTKTQEQWVKIKITIKKEVAKKYLEKLVSNSPGEAELKLSGEDGVLGRIEYNNAANLLNAYPF